MATIDWAAERERALAETRAPSFPPTVKLPALPQAVARFAEISRRPDASLGELARIVESDSSLMLDVLRYVNSSYVGLRHRVASVLQAIGLLGLKRATSLVVASGLEAAARARQMKLVNQQVFWRSCLEKAIFAREVARLWGADADAAFAGGLLQDFLLPVLSDQLAGQYVIYLEAARRGAGAGSQTPASSGGASLALRAGVADTNPTRQRGDKGCRLVDFEAARFGWNHAVAAGWLVHSWKLPDELVCCLVFHHQWSRVIADPTLGRTSAAAVAISALLPDPLLQEPQGVANLKALSERRSEIDLERLVGGIDDECDRLGMDAGRVASLAQRCHLAGTREHLPDEQATHHVSAG
ncbi:MAG: HDOD domain-containing protein [Planctomycetes bacterium]|nr:HDOD domain-containing protein [Planctomycetota bacterium]